MRQRFSVLLAGLVLAVGLGVVPASPAAASPTQCPSTMACVWDGVGFNTFILGVYREPGTCYTLSVSNTNRAASFYNRLTNGKHIQLYDGNGCTGYLLRDWAGWSGPFPAGSLSDIYSADRNRLSSIFFNTG